jgi:hypothetical protein
VAAPVRLVDLGFSLLPRWGWRSLALAAGLGLGFGGYMALADHTLFAGTIPEVQRITLEKSALPARLLFNARGALVDELTYRLIALTAIAWTLANLARDHPLVATGVDWAAIVLTALVIYPLGNWNYFRVLDPSAMTLLREVALHGAAGVLWGWLYWRHGWLSGLTGHLCAHLSLQPLLSVM